MRLGIKYKKTDDGIELEVELEMAMPASLDKLASKKAVASKLGISPSQIVSIKNLG